MVTHMNFKQKRKKKQEQDEVNLIAQIGLERERAPRIEIENKYVLSGGEVEYTNWTD
jgi:hypothetical protein